MSTTTAATPQLSYEARVKPRQAVVAIAAGVLLVASSVLQLSGPHTSVSELTLGLLVEHRRFTIDLVGAIIQAFGWLAVAWTLWFLLGAARARDPTGYKFVRYFPVVGALLAGIGIVGYIVGYGIQANKFYTYAAQTYPQANHLMSVTSLAIFQVMDYAGELLIAVAFVLISIQAMRVGLLTRFMGYLGIIAGALVLFVITPVPIVQAYWLVALGVLFLGRWPTGTPPAWASGRVEKWPSSQQLREERAQARNGRGRGKPQTGPARGKPQTGPARGKPQTGPARGKPQTSPAPEPVPASTPAASARGPRSATPKRKRKRRK